MIAVRPIWQNPFFLGGLLTVFFLLRLIGCLQPHFLTLDESIYATLGYQLRHHPTDYSTQSIFATVDQYYRPHALEYLNRPLFKHPPLYPLTLAAFYLFLGSHVFAALAPSLLSWIGICLMTRKITQELFSPVAGFLAFLICLVDPLGWALSVKIYAECLMTLLLLIALWLYLRDISSGSLGWCGTFLGLACLVKYPAIVYAMVIVFHLGVTQRFKSIPSLAVPLLLILSPWIAMQIAAHPNGGYRTWFSDYFVASGFFKELLILACLSFFILQPLLIVAKKTSFWDKPLGRFCAQWLPTSLMALPLAWHGKAVLAALPWGSLPWTSYLGDSPGSSGFYFSQTLIYLPLFWIVPLAPALLLESGNKNRLFFLIGLAFFYFTVAIFWTNAQMRYLYPIFPVLMVLSAASWHRVWKKWGIGRVILAALILFSMAKTLHNDWFLGALNLAGRF